MVDIDEMKMEYYVLNVDFKGEVNRWNIYNNSYVKHWCLKEIKKYLRSPAKYKVERRSWGETVVKTGIDALCEEFKSIFAHEFRARYQYEFSVSRPFPTDNEGNLKDEFYKKDIFYLLEPNLKNIVYDAIRQYKDNLKNGIPEDYDEYKEAYK